ncbi:MAG: hypothetical protein GY774_03535, partial [Planctomycetes bacterium]|nr:hypothetical protein [Planctomycetota bacterium]
EDMLGATYDSLTVEEFAVGFMRQANDKRFKKVSKYMRRYYVEIMDDAKDRLNWPTVRAFHAVFMTLLEKGEIKWKKKSKIELLKTKHIYTARFDDHNNQQRRSIEKAPPPKKPEKPLIPCPNYQKGNCPFKEDHDNLSHCCANCYRKNGDDNKHPEANCFDIIGVPSRLQYKNTKKF